MLNYKRKKETKGQVGDTMTWIVATLIIVALLIFFIYVSSVLAKTKGIERLAKGFFSDEDFDGGDWVEAKTSLAYEINNKNKVIIDRWIGENNATKS